ncbi:MAG: AAA family ATPase [Phycisphaerales bacterium]|nr:AAA family ATPase [Phycisphaerales bacterium]
MTWRRSIAVERAVPTAVEPSERVLEVASMFGLGVDEARPRTIVPRTAIELCGGEVIFITGPSGSGKSTILRCIADECAGCLRFEDMLNGRDDRPIIEQVGSTVEEAALILSLAGLADAFAMLRRPSELSDGQRYRLGLARLIERATHAEELAEIVILADEFGATLDRLTAAAAARNVRRWVDRSPRVCFIAATTHEDLIEALEPDVLICKPLGGGIEIHRRSRLRDPEGAS